jgi:hypothetical protein
MFNSIIYSTGTKVIKLSHKPFKSGSVVNNVKEVVTHVQTGLPGYTFIEDDSVVECRRVISTTSEII